MKHTGALPLVTAAGGAAAFSLRLAQMRTGFSPETGLPVAGALHGRLLIALILAFSVLLALLVQPLPSRRPEPRFLRLMWPAGMLRWPMRWQPGSGVMRSIRVCLRCCRFWAASFPSCPAGAVLPE